jgi:hypothetical protein
MKKLFTAAARANQRGREICTGHVGSNTLKVPPRRDT